MPRRVDPALERRAMALRREKRLSLEEIHRRLKGAVSVGTLSLWLRRDPLRPEELTPRFRLGARATNAVKAVYTPQIASRTARLVARRPSKGTMLELALHATERRLARRGYRTGRNGPTAASLDVYDGTRLVARLRVRAAHRRPGEGRPVVKTQTERGHRYTAADCDAVIGYDLETDQLYVFPIAMCGGAQRSCQPAQRNAWASIGLTGARSARPRAVRKSSRAR